MAGGRRPASSRPEVSSAWQLTTPMVPASRSQPIIFIMPRDIVIPGAVERRKARPPAKMWG